MKERHLQVTCECGETVRGTIELNIHQKTDCIYKMMTCQYCQEQFKQIEFSDHTERCGNEPFQCLECGESYKRKFASTHVCSRKCHCGQRIPLKMYIFHKITDCPQRRALCTFCKLPRLTRTFDEHLNYCGSRTENCLNCGQLVILKHMEDHINSNCTQYSAKQVSNNTNDLPPEYLNNLDFFNNAANFGASDPANAPVVCPPAMEKNNTMEDIMSEPDNNLEDIVEPAAASAPNPSSFQCPACGQVCSDADTLQLHKQLECVATQYGGFSQSWKPYQMPNQTQNQLSRQARPHQTSSMWSCAVCTLENVMSDSSCMACGIPKPGH